jgi:hypothetical protein
MAMAAPMAGRLGGGPAPTPPPLPLVHWHVASNGQATGPFSAAQLAQAVAAGTLRSDTLLWSAGMAGWMAAGQVPQLAGLFPPQPPVG